MTPFRAEMATMGTTKERKAFTCGKNEKREVRRENEKEGRQDYIIFSGWAGTWRAGV